jgi:Uma2 family endonuclease
MNAMTDSGVMKHRLTVDDYYRMAEVGVLAPDARVELIEGEIIDMPPIGSRHGGTVSWLIHRLVAAVGDGAIVTSQSALRLNRYNEPQPDLMLLRPRADYYRRSHPTAEDVLVLIEISDSTWRYDREIKVPLYARHGVREAWIVGLKARELHCFRAPHNGQYTDVIAIQTPGTIPVPTLGGVEIDLSELFE